jgi:hypothetical protein
MSLALSNLKQNPVEERVKNLNDFPVTSGVILCVILNGNAYFMELFYC